MVIWLVLREAETRNVALLTNIMSAMRVTRLWHVTKSLGI
jgi:hypothetical protein